MIPFFIAAAAALAFLFARDSVEPLAPLVKAIPVLVLAVGVSRSGPQLERRLVALGLFISALADAALEFSFLSGLAAFLLAHLLYIAAFTGLGPRWHALRLVPVALWAALVLPLLATRAGSLQIPVLLYGLVIFVMIWRAAAAVGEPDWRSGAIGLSGAILFGISDTLLGYVRFVEPVAHSRLLIMGTYWIGQALIAASFMRPRRTPWPRFY